MIVFQNELTREAIAGIDQRHGGPFDRGAADSWYSRPFNPHYFKGATHQSEEVTEKDMTAEEIDEYRIGYLWNEKTGGKKQWA